MLVLTSLSSASAEQQRDRSVSGAVTLSGGLAWVEMGQFSSATDSYFEQLDRQVEGFEARGSKTSSLAMMASARGQLRLPRHITVELGIEIFRNRRSTPISIGSSDGTIGFENTSVLIPIALGFHLPLAKRLAAFASAGPVLVVRNRSSWDYSLGEISSFDSGLGGGFEVGTGIELRAVGPLAVIATGRYRFAKSGELSASGPELPPLQPVRELGWKGLALEVGARLIF